MLSVREVFKYERVVPSHGGNSTGIPKSTSSFTIGNTFAVRLSVNKIKTFQKNHNYGQKYLHMFLFRSDLMTEFTQSSFRGSETAIVYDDCINYITMRSALTLKLIPRELGGV